MVVETVEVTPDGNAVIGWAPFMVEAGTGTALGAVAPERKRIGGA